jgi:hypothetical protein
LAFHAVCGLISLGVVTVLWRLGERAGFTERFTNFLVEIGFADSVKISGSNLFAGATRATIALVLHNTVVTILLAVLYNLLSGLLGGLIISVVEDDQVRTVGTKRSASNQPKEKIRESETPKTTEKAPRGKARSSSEGDRPKRRVDVEAAVAPRPNPSRTAPVPPAKQGSAASDFDVDGDLDGDESDWLTNLGDNTMDDPHQIVPKSRAQGDGYLD